MNSTIMYFGQAIPFVGWLAIDEFAELLAYYLNGTLLSPKPLVQSRAAGYLLGKNRFEPIDSAGGDILIVVARSPSDLYMVRSISGYRKKFSKIYGFISDSYHLESYADITGEFDAVFVTAHEDVNFVENKFKIPVKQMYQGIDTLRWGPVKKVQRSIDILGFGRIPDVYQSQLTQTFHQPDSPYLYLHSPLGNITGPTIELERGMLFKVLQRSKVSLAFHLYVGATGRRPISMMVTSRWLESLLSGCIVVGKKPVSRMAEDMLFWKNATVEISDDVSIAVEEIKSLLENSEDYDQQRNINTANIILHHDWRFRIMELCDALRLEYSRNLVEDVDIVKANGANYL